MIYTIRTTIGRENTVVETLRNRVQNTGVAVKSMLHPQELKGYVFIEGEMEAIEEVVSGMPHVRGIIRKEVKI